MSECDEIQVNLTMNLKIPKEGISIDSVLHTVNRNLSSLGIAMAKALLAGLEEKAVEEKLASNPGYVRNGHQSNERQIKSSFGSFGYRLVQLYDPVEKRTCVPLKEKLQWPDYRQYMNESVWGGVGLVSHLSFRQSVKESQRMLGTEQSASTFHRMFQLFSENYGAWPSQKEIPYRFLMADGTKVRLQDGRSQDLGKGEMQWVMASEGIDLPFKPVGFWINQGWEDIKGELKELIDYPKLEVLFADGEREIQALLEDGMRLQRCVLHGWREFAHKLYLDGFKKRRQKGLRKELNGLPVFHLNQAKMEKLDEKDRIQIEAMVNRSKTGLEELVGHLDPDKYPYARAYIENLKGNLFTFFDYWLSRGQWIPLTTNAIESAFSRVKNRIWSIGKRWTEKGLLNWLRITIQKIFQPDIWENFWTDYLKLNPNFQLISLEATYRWLA